MRSIYLSLLILVVASCGVKGIPLPPEEPPYIGHGKPTFRQATKGLELKKNSKKKVIDDWDEEQEDDSESRK